MKKLKYRKDFKEIRKMDMRNLHEVKKMIISYNEADTKPYVYKSVYIRLIGRIFVLNDYMTNNPKKQITRGIYTYCYDDLMEMCCDGAIFGYTSDIFDKSGRSIFEESKRKVYGE